MDFMPSGGQLDPHLHFYLHLDSVCVCGGGVGGVGEHELIKCIGMII